jgi:Fe-S-cluster-containing hydrogenase component 2
MKVRGLIPVTPTGGTLYVEDQQSRLHRVRARAIVRVDVPSAFPTPFLGSHLAPVIDELSALQLLSAAGVHWGPEVVILGTGNSAFRMGVRLIREHGVRVTCVESRANWGGKRIAGWEVERRQFETLGGVCLEAQPQSLKPISRLESEFMVSREGGAQSTFRVSHVISCGPFEDEISVSEHPPESGLFRLVQSSVLGPRGSHGDAWLQEEESARGLGIRIARKLGSGRSPFEREVHQEEQKKSRVRLKRLGQHRIHPFVLEYQGKWLSPPVLRSVREFSGTPKERHQSAPIASIECFEKISCTACQRACPEKAIDLKNSERILNEDACTACGKCLPVCPTQAITMIEDPKSSAISRVTVDWRSEVPPPARGQLVHLLNRRGEVLGQVRVVSAENALITVEVPEHFLWEGRAVRLIDSAPQQDRELKHVDRVEKSQRVEIIYNGEKRLARPGTSVSLALFELGQSRPGDKLLCPDGSCGLCTAEIDGVRRPACQTEIHKGMGIKAVSFTETLNPDQAWVCPCLGISLGELRDQIKEGRIQSAEALARSSRVASGRCHGALCGDVFSRLLRESGVDAGSWIDWRFPWSDWRVVSEKSD